MKAELDGRKKQIDEQIEQMKRMETDKTSLSYQLNQNSLTTTKITERHQKDINELINTHQEYQRAKDRSVQLANEVTQLKVMVTVQYDPA